MNWKVMRRQKRASGNFIYNHLEFKKKKLYLTTATAYLDENGGIILQQMEKLRVYDWKYTKKGWLIWEKAKSKNQEMDINDLQGMMRKKVFIRRRLSDRGTGCSSSSHFRRL